LIFLRFWYNKMISEDLAVLALSALAQQARLRCFRALIGAGPQGLTPGTLAQDLGISPSTLSFHLKELTHAGLVEPTRAGRHLIYRPSIDRMNALLAYLSAHCCQGADCGLAAGATAVACDPVAAETTP